MSQDEYVAADYDSTVSIESYVQGKTNLINGKANFFLQSEDGAYFVYEMQCSEDDYHQLSEGQKVRITGTKSIWKGETEITDATFEILDGTYIATPQDLTDFFDEYHSEEDEYFRTITL